MFGKKRIRRIQARYGKDPGTRYEEEDLREIRRIAREVLPGARIRRGLYHRYLLRWTGPAG